MQFPGSVLRRGRGNRTAIAAVQRRLMAIGYGPFSRPGVFDADTESAVRQFQAQHTDATGLPLRVDGQVGPFTWAALFPSESVPDGSGQASALCLQALAIASSQIGVMEVPPGSNRGPKVDDYLSGVGIGPRVGKSADRAWCAAFVHWCFEQAARSIGKVNPVPRVAGVLTHWELAKGLPAAKIITKAWALKHQDQLTPGLILIYDFGRGRGHTGLLERVETGRMVTVEGNINDGSVPGREGVGVFRTSRRKLTDEQLVGFIDYGAA